MLKIMIAISIVAIILVGYMYSQNYITFEGGLHIVLPAKAPITKSVEKFEPANVEPSHIDTNLIASVNLLVPSKSSTQIKNRLFDDIVVAVQTFSPLVMPFITFYLYKKKKKIDFQKA